MPSLNGSSHLSINVVKDKALLVAGHKSAKFFLALVGNDADMSLRGKSADLGLNFGRLFRSDRRLLGINIACR
jgi:hypothetical protein